MWAWQEVKGTWMNLSAYLGSAFNSHFRLTFFPQPLPCTSSPLSIHPGWQGDRVRGTGCDLVLFVHLGKILLTPWSLVSNSVDLGGAPKFQGEAHALTLWPHWMHLEWEREMISSKSHSKLRWGRDKTQERWIKLLYAILHDLLVLGLYLHVFGCVTFQNHLASDISLPHWYLAWPCDLFGPVEYGGRRVSPFWASTAFCWHSWIPVITDEHSMHNVAPVQRGGKNTWCKWALALSLDVSLANQCPELEPFGQDQPSQMIIVSHWTWGSFVMRYWCSICWLMHVYVLALCCEHLSVQKGKEMYHVVSIYHGPGLCLQPCV